MKKLTELELVSVLFSSDVIEQHLSIDFSGYLGDGDVVKSKQTLEPDSLYYLKDGKEGYTYLVIDEEKNAFLHALGMVSPFTLKAFEYTVVHAYEQGLSVLDAVVYADLVALS